MVLTMAAVAENKGISCTSLAVSVEGFTTFVDLRASTHFVSRLDLGEDLTPRERRILFNAARQCEVHKMLRGEMTFEERLEEPSTP
jgi:uncharacterized OsmC-like protein